MVPLRQEADSTAWASVVRRTETYSVVRGLEPAVFATTLHSAAFGCQPEHMTNAERRPIGWIREVVLNCEQPFELATFWAGLLGAEPVEWYPGWVTLEPPPHGQRLSFQATQDRAGGSSVGGGTFLVHFDILVDELDEAHQRVVAAGGVFESEQVSPRPGVNGEPVPWRVYHDPAGHPFCLVVR
jgi:Glyoxalase-like domain